MAASLLASDTGVRLGAGDIERVARAIFTPREWHSSYGARYYNAESHKSVQRWCFYGRLPAGWSSIRRGDKHYIFYAGRHLPRRPRRTHKKYDPPCVSLSAHKLVALDPAHVSQVFERLFTVREWVDSFGARHGINSVEYVYEMCAARPNERAGHSPARLPHGWRPIRLGSTWLIYHDSLARRAELVISGGEGGS